MIASLMLYSILIAALASVGAWALERAIPGSPVPLRVIWLGTLGLTLVLTAGVPARGAVERAPTLGIAVPMTSSVAASSGPTASTSVLTRVRAAWDHSSTVVTGFAARADRGLASTLLVVIWAAASLLSVLALTFTLTRSARQRRAWPLRRIHGHAVRVSPEAGPLVAGLRRPEIVVPEWLLSADEEEQRIVVRHEAEHVRGHDTLALAAGLVAIALTPWNPVVWWMVSRLRLAVEIDCDRRVLERGIGVARYAETLLEVAGRTRPSWSGAPALLESPGQLQRRILAMTHHPVRHAALRGLAFASLGLVALVAACETKVPTASEIDAMDVQRAEAQLARARIDIGSDPNATYFIDGRAATAEEARALTAERIGSIEVLRKRGDGEAEATSEIRIFTPEGLAARGEVAPRDGRVPFTLEQRGERVRSLATEMEGFEGLLLIDGVKADPSRFRSLSPDDIVSVRIVKGEAAAGMHPDPQARNGIIRITTRAGAERN
jgi:beta-lactamase regulating signal transducer with metallopeptidase domain